MVFNYFMFLVLVLVLVTICFEGGMRGAWMSRFLLFH